MWFVCDAYLFSVAVVDQFLFRGLGCFVLNLLLAGYPVHTYTYSVAFSRARRRHFSAAHGGYNRPIYHQIVRLGDMVQSG